jgi:hypothetical protein
MISVTSEVIMVIPTVTEQKRGSAHGGTTSGTAAVGASSPAR